MDTVNSTERVHNIMIGTTWIQIKINRQGVDSLFLSQWERMRLKAIIDEMFYYIYSLEEVIGFN